MFCGAYREDEFQELLQYADHIVFNSIHQLKAFGPRGKQAGKSLGLRVNPECSTQEGHAIYDPCAPGSRMGVTRNVWDQEMDEATLSLLDGIHFHTLCEQNSDDLKTTLAAVEEKFGDILPEMKWINMGAGTTSPARTMIWAPWRTVSVTPSSPGGKCLPGTWGGSGPECRIFGQPGAGRGGKRRCQDRHLGRQRRLPHARRAGNALPAPILGASTEPGEGHMFRLAGPTCLAGDVIGDYDFDRPLQEGDLVLLGDMAIYTTCKTIPSTACLSPISGSWTAPGVWSS